MSEFPGRQPSVAASGINFPKKLRGDDEMIVLFQGTKDISQHLDEDEPAIYLIFFDGVNTFNMSQGYKMAQVDWKTETWYYCLNAGLIETKLNPMVDWEVTALGKSGETVDCSERINKGGKLKLVPEEVSRINYTQINNPFRGTANDPNEKGKPDKKG